MAAPHSHILIMYSHERTDAFCATASALGKHKPCRMQEACWVWVYWQAGRQGFAGL